MTDHEDGDADPQLQALRAVWLAMPDEDPPERGLADLMAAARVKAEQMTQPSWWQRTLAVLRRPPVLALATVMVLVGGAVFIGKRSDTVEVQPTATGEDLQQERSRDQSPAMPDPHAAAPIPVETVAPEEAPAVAAPAAEVKRPAPATPRPPRRVERPADTAGGKDQKAQPARERNDTTFGVGGGGVGAAPGGSTASAGTLESETSPFSPPPEATADSVETTPTKGAASAPAEPKASEGQKQVPVSQYFAQAKSAAGRGDCAATRVLAKKIASRDAAYYRDVVLKDASIRSCVSN